MPRPKVFTVGLSAADREFLVKLTTTGVHPARMIMRSRVLLELDENAGPVPDQVVVAARALTSTTTVRVVARRFTETGGDILATIGRKPRETPHTMPTRFFALLFLGAAVSAGESFRISVFSLMMLSYSTR